MSPAAANTPEEQAQRRARSLTALLWHIGAFVIVNGFFWLMDYSLGTPGMQWAYWITAIWGFGLLFHILAWFIQGRDLEGRKTREYLDQSQQRDAPTSSPAKPSERRPQGPDSSGIEPPR